MVFWAIMAMVTLLCFSADTVDILVFLAINFAALNNLLQMFNNNMNLNGTKPPLLPPPPSGASSNMNLSSQHGSNQSLNLPEQQHSLNSPRSTHPPNPNAGSFNNDSSLLMCATGAYSSPGPSSSTTSGPPANHHPQNGGLPSAVSTPGSASYPPAMASLYTNSASPLSNGGAGKKSSKTIEQSGDDDHDRFRCPSQSTKSGCHVTSE